MRVGCDRRWLGGETPGVGVCMIRGSVLQVSDAVKQT